MLCNCCGVDTYDLKFSNKIWNQANLSSPRRVGYLVEMCEQGNFEDKQDFLTWFEKEYPGKLFDIATEFSMITKMPVDEAYKATIHRVVCETWIGWDREQRAVQALQLRYPKATFVHATKEEDWKYGLDFKVYINDVLKGGIQVKPPSWRGTADYMMTAKSALKRKFELFYNAYGVKAYTIICNDDGSIDNYKE